MKNSPLLDFSFSTASSGIIAGLFFYKPEGFEFFAIAVPAALSLVLIGMKYLAAWLQISSYENFSAVRKLKARKKYLQTCLDDEHLSEEAKEEHQQNYEKTTAAISEALDR